MLIAAKRSRCGLAKPTLRREPYFYWVHYTYYCIAYLLYVLYLLYYTILPPPPWCPLTHPFVSKSSPKAFKMSNLPCRAFVEPLSRPHRDLTVLLLLLFCQYLFDICLHFATLLFTVPIVPVTGWFSKYTPARAYGCVYFRNQLVQLVPVPSFYLRCGSSI